MERVVLLVLVAVAMVNTAARAQHNLTTLNEFFLDQKNLQIPRLLDDLRNDSELQTNTDDKSFLWTRTPLTVTKEVLDYIKSLEETIIFGFGTVLENITVQSIYEDVNENCSEYLEKPIEDLRTELSNTTCVTILLAKTLTSKLKTAIKVDLQCDQKWFAFCLEVDPNCTLAHEQRLRLLLTTFIEDVNDAEQMDGTTPLEIITNIVITKTRHVYRILTSVYNLLELKPYFSASASLRSIEPFEIENLLQPSVFIRTNNAIRLQDRFTWGIVRSNTATVDVPCHNYRHLYPTNSKQFLTFLYRCTSLNLLRSVNDLMRCSYKDPSSKPLTWSTSPVYFHSHCLCLASGDNECGVKVPENVNPRLYCLSVLLRDFQKQISYRPAVTYLDYAFQTQVPVCKFSNFMQIAFRSDCDDTLENNNRSLDLVVSAQCYFKDLVSKNLNCSETLLMNSYNLTILCSANYFLEFIPCDGNDEVHIPYYGAGNSTQLLVLTYVDVAVRVITLIPYLAYPQLRNFPGKLLIGYQVTALFRLILVRATLADFALAVYLDVAMDMASTFWLTACLHFLTWCFNSVRYSVRESSSLALRVLQSTRPNETRLVLLCYTLFGWALPATLSALFFWMNEAIDSRIQVGQLFFVMCNYIALFANLYMFFRNCLLYYEIKYSVSLIEEGVRKRDVFFALFNFAVKTSVLTGAGITLRLVFIQIQGLEHLLGYYHALGKLQGLMLFTLFGCNYEARDFWLRVVSSTFHHIHRRQNTAA